MRDFLAREAAQVQAEAALKARQREELRLWLEALAKSSKAEEMVRASIRDLPRMYLRLAKKRA